MRTIEIDLIQETNNPYALRNENKSLWDFSGSPVTNFLAEHGLSAESKIENYFDSVHKPKDGVGNTTIIEGFKSLPESLNHKTSIEERNEMFRAAYRAESGEEIQPKRRSFQWLASRFEGATIALHDVNVEAYDNFAEYARRPEEQLVIIGVLKKMAAGTVASWAYQETRKIKGEEKKMGKEAADEALNAFNYLTGLELSLLAKLEEKGTDVNSNYKREVDEILRRIPLGVATASVVLTLMLTSCGTNPGPNQTDIDSGQNQPQVSEVVGLPTPGIGITPGGVETISSPSPTPTVVENGNFGLLTQSSEWPGTGINVSELAKRLHENGELKPAKHIEEDSPEWVDIESQGGNIDGLMNAIVKKLRDQGITKYSLNVVQNTGWAIEVRDESGNILWSQSVDENGNVVLNEHPNRITEDSQFGKLDAESFDLKEGEVVEFDVQDGIPIGIVVNQEGDVVGNVNTTTKTIDIFEKEEVPDMTEIIKERTLVTFESDVIVEEKDRIWLAQFNNITQSERVQIASNAKKLSGMPLKTYHITGDINDEKKKVYNSFPVFISKARFIDMRLSFKELNDDDTFKHYEKDIGVAIIPGLIQTSNGKYVVVNYLMLPESYRMGIDLYKDYKLGGSEPNRFIFSEDMADIIEPGEQYEVLTDYISSTERVDELLELLKKGRSYKDQVVIVVAVLNFLNDSNLEFIKRLESGESIPDGLIVGIASNIGKGVNEKEYNDILELLGER